MAEIAGSRAGGESGAVTQLLIELFSEEIPARMQGPAAAELQRLVEKGLAGAELRFDSVQAFSTPRRLALVVDGLPRRQPDRREERKGPKVGAPDKAIEGFLRSVGLDSVDQCAQQDTPKGPVWVAVIESKGLPTADVLPEIVREAVRQLSWPKSMRFAAQQFRWVRPLHGVLAVFDGKVLDGGLDLHPGRLAFAGATRGHRFLAPDEFPVRDFETYKAGLSERYVILDPVERRASIERQLRDAAEAEGLVLHPDEALLDEVTGLVEWPVVLAGRVDDAFMDLPPEVLTVSMRAHQKYFRFDRPDGSMAPRFGVVANMAAKDGGKAIVAGNERVLRARLADARFFWDQDRKVRLEDRLPDLEKIVFHAKLGTVAERVERIAALAEELAGSIPDCDAKLAGRAARLAKADLVTGMVGEFPELQGVMGRYYALAQGEAADVADAVAEHYSPLGPNDRCPTAPVSVAVALAEKLDTLVGFWAIDEKPTGSKDPYALRRAALGVIRLVLENALRIPLSEAMEAAIARYEAPVVADTTLVVTDMLAFFADRLKVHLRGEGVRHDLIAAVFALAGEDDLVRLVRRVGALQAFLDGEDGANLLTAYRRAANILRIEEKKDGVSHDGAPSADLFDAPEEKALAGGLDSVRAEVGALLGKEEFEAAMTAMAALRAPVDAFFDRVTVNAEDAGLRENRLRLLAQIRDTMNQVADFGQIEG